MKKRWIFITNFLVLGIILILTVLLFQLVSANKTLQTLVGILLSFLYVTWGLIYHSMQGDLHPKVVVEYLLVGSIAVTLICTIVWM